MKKAITILTAMITAIIMLTGCSADPVATELQNFLNNDMVEINAKYEDLKAEMAKWENLASDAELVSSLNETVMPNINGSLELLSKIELQTEEMKEIKTKYQNVLEAYKEGFQSLLSSIESADQKAMDAAWEKIQEGIDLLTVYNDALKDLATEKNLTLEY